MNRIIGLIVLFLFPFVSNAQIGDTVITRNNEKVYKFNDVNYYPLIISDRDQKEYNWLGLCGNKFDAYKVDNNLNIIDSIKTSAEYLPLKYNNKLYDIAMYKMYNMNNNYIDSISFHCYDINGNPLINKIISTYDSDTLKYLSSWSHPLFTNNKNFIVFLISVSNSNTPYSKIINIDTLGNILNTKIYKFDNNSYFDIVETNNNLELLFNKMDDSIFSKILVLNKNTLDIVDTIEGFSSRISTSNLYNIDDSTFVTAGNYIYGEDLQMQIKIVNRNTSKTKTIKFPLGLSNDIDLDCNFPEFSKKLDHIKTDSIYYVCYSYKDTINNGVIIPMNSEYQILRIMNFNINGTLNYDYAYGFDTITWKYVNGIKATTDGGLIIAVKTLTEGYFIKFMPNGFVGLSNVETGERASLRVYPNPAKDFVLVDIEADRFDKADIEIYDLGGRMVMKSKLSAKVGNRIDVSDLKAGVYSYRVALNGKGVSGKIVIGE